MYVKLLEQATAQMFKWKALYEITKWKLSFTGTASLGT